MSYSLTGDTILGSLAGDAEIAELFSAEADIAAMVSFEIALAKAEAECGVIPVAASEAFTSAMNSFSPDFAFLSAGGARDGVVVPELIGQMRAAVPSAHAEHFHFGTTSQDVIDTSLMLRLKQVVEILMGRLKSIDAALGRLANAAGEQPFMARTRMQYALEITLGDRIGIWRAPLSDRRGHLEAMFSSHFPVQFAGATGTLKKLGEKGPGVRAEVARRLELNDPGRSWHTDRAVIADWGHALMLVTGTLGKMGQDIALMAQNGIGTLTLEGGGGSSAMPHKSNPVNAEILVSLARFNATLISGLDQALVHEQERSGAAWTLEWLILPQICVTAGAATRVAINLLGQIRFE